MAVFRVERTRDYTVMSNYHLKDTGLTLKAKGLLSMMLSLPDEWNYTTRGLASICKESVETIGKTLRELESAGYLTRRQLRGKNGRITDTEYTIFEKPVKPQPEPAPPDTASPGTENPDMNAAFQKYSKNRLKKEQRRESVLGKLKKFKELVKAPVPNREKRREQER